MVLVTVVQWNVGGKDILAFLLLETYGKNVHIASQLSVENFTGFSFI